MRPSSKPVIEPRPRYTGLLGQHWFESPLPCSSQGRSCAYCISRRLRETMIWQLMSFGIQIYLARTLILLFPLRKTSIDKWAKWWRENSRLRTMMTDYCHHVRERKRSYDVSKYETPLNLLLDYLCLWWQWITFHHYTLDGLACLIFRGFGSPIEARTQRRPGCIAGQNQGYRGFVLISGR